MKTFGISVFVLLAAANGQTPALAQSPRPSMANRAAPRAAHRENRWRYVWHNDRWWYWTTDERWSYFDGRRWVEFDARRPASGRLALGYRKAPAFESPPSVPPRPPRSWPGEAAGIEADLLNPFSPGGAAENTAPLLAPAPSRVRGGVGGLETLGRGMAQTVPSSGGPKSGGAGATGGGGFGGPTGRSLGAGSAAGGASSPQ